MEDFVIVRNPDEQSSLPYLIRVPLPGRPVVLKAKDTWPRIAKIYCHRAEEWPADAEVVERVPTRACQQRGASIDLMLDRSRENRSQLVFTRIKGREAIFWQSPRTAKQARPAVTTPRARAAGLARFTVLVDSHERYAYRFAGQQVDLVKRSLPAGDYAVEVDGRVIAAVERKSLPDLVSSATNGKLRFALGELSVLRRQSSSRTGGRLSSSWCTSAPRSLPTRSPSCRCASRRCRCSSPRPERWRRSGPTGGSPPRLPSTTWPAAAPNACSDWSRPATCRPSRCPAVRAYVAQVPGRRHRERLLRSVHGPSVRDCQSATAAACDPRSWRPTRRLTHHDRDVPGTNTGYVPWGNTASMRGPSDDQKTLYGGWPATGRRSRPPPPW